MGAIYAAIFYVGCSNASNVMPVVSIERSIFYRERAAGMYSALPYALAQVHWFSFLHYLIYLCYIISVDGQLLLSALLKKVLVNVNNGSPQVELYKSKINLFCRFAWKSFM